MAGSKKTDDPVMVEPVTTAIGCWGTKGLIPIGTRFEIPVEAFSENWMKLITVNDKKKLTQFRRQQAEDKAELAAAKSKAENTVIIHSAADKEVGVLREEVAELKAEVAELKAEVAEMKPVIDELRARLAETQAEVAEETAQPEVIPDAE